MEQGDARSTTSRSTVSALEALLFEPRPVLDHGFVRVVDYMGDDSAIVQAARVSHGLGTKTPQQDRALIRYLMRHDHTSPFEMCEIKLHVRLPIFVARQWIRHRTANVNEYSGRYSVVAEEFYVPQEQAVAGQSVDLHQGRGEQLPPEAVARDLALIRETSEAAYRAYHALLADEGGSGDGRPADGGPDAGGGSAPGVARELARIVLPLGAYTEWYWKIDLHNLLHFLELRLAPTAQLEIRAYAEAIAAIAAAWVPVTWEAFEDYRLRAARVSRSSIAVLRRVLAGERVAVEGSGLTKSEWGALTETFGIEPAG